MNANIGRWGAALLVVAAVALYAVLGTRSSVSGVMVGLVVFFAWLLLWIMLKLQRIERMLQQIAKEQP